MPLRPRMELREYGKLFLRRKWQVVFSVLFILFTASVYCVVTPELYKSSITILVIPQPFPQDYVRARSASGRTAVGHDQAAGDEPHDADEGDGRATPLREGAKEAELRGTIRDDPQADRDRRRPRASRDSSDAFSLSFLHESRRRRCTPRPGWLRSSSTRT